jgi:two-component system alkaline phosphatase synthesis response regulator PhoP
VNNKKILVVDDEPNLVRSLTFFLSKGGYEVYSAHDGEEALQKMHEVRPDIIFLDVMMPKKSGYEVCQEIRHSPELENIYVIMLSANGQETDREKSLTAGANEFITKPFSPIAVVRRVKELLG